MSADPPRPGDDRGEDKASPPVVHELLNGLAVIRGRAQLLRRRLRGSDHPQTERILTGLAQIDASTGRMTELVNALHPRTRRPSPGGGSEPEAEGQLRGER